MRASLCRRFSSSVPYPTIPYRKELLERKRQYPVRRWPRLNAPHLMSKYLRYAERVSTELGSAKEMASFNEASAAFQKPPHIVVATILERPAVIMRDVEEWESSFMAASEERRVAGAKRYPQQLIDMITASSTSALKQDASSGNAKAKGGASPTAAAAVPEAGGAAGSSVDLAASEAAAAVTGAAKAEGKKRSGGDDAAKTLSSFYERDPEAEERAGGAGAGADDGGLSSLVPRETAADRANDVQSLDRAYSQRLILLAKQASTQTWTIPGTVVLQRGEQEKQQPVGKGSPSESMLVASKRSLAASFDLSAEIDIWHVGNSPIGHSLIVYSKEDQEALKTYGAKVFFYRAEIQCGRIGVKSAQQQLSAASAASIASPICGPFDAFAWVTRDEAEKYLPRPSFKYLHQIMGSGPGEEMTRRAAWLERIQAKGLTVAQATGRRAFRVQAGRVAGTRLPAIATQEQARIASSPWSEDGKAKSLILEVGKHHENRRQAKKHSEALRVQLQTPTGAMVLARALEARRAAAPQTTSS